MKSKRIDRKDAQPPWQCVVTGDCLDILRSLPSGCARLVFAHPPDNTGVDYGDGPEADCLSDLDYRDWCRPWLSECARILTDNGSLWIVTTDEFASSFRWTLERLGLRRRSWIGWASTFDSADKADWTGRRIDRFVKNLGCHVYRSMALAPPAVPFNKQDRVWTAIWKIPGVDTDHAEYISSFPTQLPLDLLRPIIGLASRPGDYVVDPFSGSATTGVAAVELGRRYIGIESRATFAELSRTRLEGAGS